MKKILIIDDSSDMQTLFRAILSSRYMVYLASTGQEGLEYLEDKRPDLIILDIGLPEIDGYEICHEIRTNSSHRNIPIIFVSGKKGVSAHTMAYKLGGDDYLEKPFENTELLAMIESKLLRFTNSTEDLIKFEEIAVSLRKKEVSINDQIVKFTPKEFDIFVYLLKNPYEVVARDKLMEQIWGLSSDITDRAIDNHITAIRKKIKESRVKIMAIYSSGYKLTKE